MRPQSLSLIRQMKTDSRTSGRLLARNTFWNLLGQGAPLAAAVIAFPPLIRGLGIDRYGVLSLVWTLIGYFSFLDLGLGRALTKLVAERLGNIPEEERLAMETWTASAAHARTGSRWARWCSQCWLRGWFSRC